MPIRFRCVFCNQLMGISRRKVGTVVRCPVCASSVTVPDQPEVHADAGSSERGKRTQEQAAKPPLFEQSDFDQLFNAPHVPARPAPAPIQPFHAESVDPAPPNLQALPENGTVVPPTSDYSPHGILITRKRATLLCVAVVVAVAAAFVLGLWVATLLQTRPG